MDVYINHVRLGFYDDAYPKAIAHPLHHVRRFSFIRVTSIRNHKKLHSLKRDAMP